VPTREPREIDPVEPVDGPNGDRRKPGRTRVSARFDDEILSGVRPVPEDDDEHPDGHDRVALHIEWKGYELLDLARSVRDHALPVDPLAIGNEAPVSRPPGIGLVARDGRNGPRRHVNRVRGQDGVEGREDVGAERDDEERDEQAESDPTHPPREGLSLFEQGVNNSADNRVAGNP